MQRSTLILSMAVAVLTIFIVPGNEARMTMAQLRSGMKGMGKSCVGKTGVATDVVAKTKEGVFTEDHALQCYYLCLLNQLKIIKDGNLILPAVHKQIDMMMPTELIPRFKKVTEDCMAAMIDADPCVRSWQYMICYWNADSEIYFFP